MSCHTKVEAFTYFADSVLCTISENSQTVSVENNGEAVEGQTSKSRRSKKKLAKVKAKRGTAASLDTKKLDRRTDLILWSHR